MDSFEISSDNYDPTSINQAPTEKKTTGNPTPRTEPQKNRTAQRSQKNAESGRKTADVERASIPGRWSMFAGIVLILAAVYLLISSISYFAHGADDQSIVEGSTYSEVAGQAARIGNTGGPAGAFLSHLMLSGTLGLGAFIIIFYAAALGLSLLKVRHFKFWDLTYKCLLSAITLSVLAGFVTYSLTSYNYWGGDHGHYINSLVMQHAGIWGAIAVNILLVSAVILVFLREIQTAYNLYRARMERHRAKLAAERAEAAARRHKMESMLTDPEVGEKSSMDNTENPAGHSEITPSPTTETPAETMPVAADAEPTAVAPLEDIPDSIPERRPFADEEAPAPSVVESPASEPVQSHYVQPLQPEQTVQTLPVSAPVQPVHPVQTAETAPTDTADAAATDTPEVSDVPMTINTAPAIDQVEHISTGAYDPTAELSRFRMPSIELLEEREQSTDHVDIAEQEENKMRLTKTLETFNVKLKKIEATIGPTITRYEIILAEGIRAVSVKRLAEDLALALSAYGIRISIIPGKGTIGIEVPNKKPQTVGIRNILSSEAFQNSKADLPIAMGSTIDNEVYVADLAKLPHLLVAGATGMGKSVGLNTIIASLLYKKHPAELKFVLIDPKRVELSLYSKLERHYLAALPGEEAIIKDTSKVVNVLNSLCIEMGNRLNLLEEAGVRNIKEYNEKFIARRLNPNKHHFLPYIVLVIDEFADIILTAGKEVENPVSRLAAVARAAGIHLIIATQRPTVNVITGGIKTNIPGRIAFRVNQGNDSKTILDTVGANQLNGKGDMLFSQNGKIDRVQCAFIDTDEVKAICDSISEQIGYAGPYELPEYVPAGTEGAASSGNLTDRDGLFAEAAQMVVTSGRASTTELQRRLSIGFGRAGRIMDQLETAGVVGPAQGSKPRQVLMDHMALENYLQLQG